MPHSLPDGAVAARCERCNAPVLEHGLCAACLLREGLRLDAGEAIDANGLQPQTKANGSVPCPDKAKAAVDGYELISELGRGGMGVVYLAEQTRPIRRRVALKLIKPGMDSRQVIARFEAERQALAVMDHPSVAKVLGAGTSCAGRPYFVMELVRGPRITEYCDQFQLSTRERLELFEHVCRAIQHAHQKGIIHRDIKPSNILVTQQDGVPVPKVIDFGIAKATGTLVLSEETMVTGWQQFLGTPAYTSPEQAEGSCDIDTRTDIYSLGVLLYELLTGKTPFDSHTLISSGLEGIRRTIRETDPPRPSTRLTTLALQELQSIARRRRVEPPKLVHAVRGDLDWIVMKCLEKDRARRYENCSGILHDIQRHLQNQPIAARPPSTLYRVQKMVRRNRLPLAVGAVVGAALLLTLTMALWSLAKSKKAQDTLNFFKSTQIDRTFLPPNQPVEVVVDPVEQSGQGLAQDRPGSLQEAVRRLGGLRRVALPPDPAPDANADSGDDVSVVGRQVKNSDSSWNEGTNVVAETEADQSGPVITPEGANYTQVAAVWWKWFMELPLKNPAGAVHPNFDSPSFDVTMGQSPGLWFLATPFGSIQRTCVIPRDTWVSVGMLNVESSSLEGGSPFFGFTAEEQHSIAKFMCDHVVGLFAEIDGVPIPDIYSYRAPSPQIVFTAPTPWAFGQLGGTGTSTGDGYFLLLRPLSSGQHVIHYGGAFEFRSPPDPFDLDAPMEMTYILNVP